MPTRLPPPSKHTQRPAPAFELLQYTRPNSTDGANPIYTTLHPLASKPATSILAQTRPHARATPFAELLGVLAPQPGGLDVGGAFVVGTAQHADDGEDDSFGRLDGRPALRGRFVAVFVFFGRVEDGLEWGPWRQRAVSGSSSGKAEFTMQTSPEG